MLPLLDFWKVEKFARKYGGCCTWGLSYLTQNCYTGLNYNVHMLRQYVSHREFRPSFFFQNTARTSAISSRSLLVAGFPEHASLTTFAAILETFELLFPSYPAHTLPSVYFLQLCVGLCADIPKYLAKFDTNSLLSFLCHSH